jgi:hypothetical protein
MGPVTLHAHQDVKGFLVLAACIFDDLFREVRRRRFLVPIDCAEIIPEILLVKTGLGPPGT